jgi:hypothetical protein
MALTQISTQGIKDGTITGTDLATNVDLVDNQKLRLGTSNEKSEIYNDGDDLFINHTEAGYLQLQGNYGVLLQRHNGTENLLRALSNGAVELYHDNSKKFETTSAGGTLTGDFTVTGNIYGGNHITIQDSDGASDMLKIGAGEDLRIYHYNNNSYIRQHTDLPLVIGGTSTGQSLYLQPKSGENSAIFKPNGAVELYYDNVKSLETTTEGIEIKKTASGQTARLKIEATNGGQAGIELRTSLSGTNRAARIDMYNQNSLQWSIFNDYQQDGTNDFSIRHGAEIAVRALTDGAVELYYDNSKVLQTHDASGYSGIDVLGDEGGHAVINLKADEGDDGADCWQWTAQTNGASYIKNLSNGSTYEYNVKMIGGGAVEVYYDAVKKFETTSTGVSVTGNIQLPDDGEVRLGADSDIRMFHSGTQNLIQSYNDKLFRIQSFGTSAQIRIQTNEGENNIVCSPNAGVELYYDNSKKFETTSQGVYAGGIIKGGSYFQGGASGTASYNWHFGAEGNGEFRFYSGNYGAGSLKQTINSNGDILAGSNNSQDLGSSSIRWRNIYTNDLNLSNEGGANDVDGTWGSYTIQEGAEDLFLVNKRNGKKYKFALTEVS